jgi:5'-nucleotidase
MNPGGIRADIGFTAPGPEPITHGEAFAVQPFSNILMTRTYTGAQIDAILERQFRSLTTPSQNVILQVSKGFSYEWDQSEPIGSKVSNITLNGVALDPAATYKVALNNFLGFGGDGFGSTLTVGTNPTFGADDLVALEAYLQPTVAGTPYSPTIDASDPLRIIPVP